MALSSKPKDTSLAFAPSMQKLKEQLDLLAKEFFQQQLISTPHLDTPDHEQHDQPDHSPFSK